MAEIENMHLNESSHATSEKYMSAHENEVKVIIGRLVFDNTTKYSSSKVFEDELDTLLVRHSLHRWASGKNMVSGVRDIACEKDVSNEDSEKSTRESEEK